MKLETVINIAPALTALASTKLPAKAALRVARALNSVRAELALFEEARSKLAGELGTLSDDKQQYLFEGDSAMQFQQGIKEMVNEEVDIAITTITSDDLGNIEIEPACLAVLDGVIIVDEPVLQ